ncbi:DUF6096 family protein [Lachnospiraceae bacterium 54-53]
MGYGLDDEMEIDEERTINEEKKPEKKKRPPFAVWNVGGSEFKLKLTTAAICRLEDKFKRNLLDLLFGSGSVPPLGIMLTITQGAMEPWNHSIKYKDVQNLFDKYCNDGGTQLTFMTDVLMEIYNVSGFFSEDQREAMDEKLEEAKEVM